MRNIVIEFQRDGMEWLPCTIAFFQFQESLIKLCLKIVFYTNDKYILNFKVYYQK